MRATLLSWWSAPTLSPAPPPPASTTTASLLSHLPSLLVPLPPPAFLAPPSLSDTLNPSAARPSLAEIVPLVLAVQQYLLAALFRSPDVRAADLAAQLDRVLGGTAGEGECKGGPSEWRALWRREGPRQELEGREREGLARRLDGMMTGMFATVTKGCAGLDGQVGACSFRLSPALSLSG